MSGARVTRIVVAALALAAAPMTSARIILVNGPKGPTYVNVPEPAGEGLVRPSSRSLPFREVIDEAARRHGVDPELVEAVAACESNFDVEAVSRAGACGLMQLMPETASSYGLEDPFDVQGNVDAGTRHLAELLRAFSGDRRLALAAYNAGRGAVERAGGMPPYPETRRYVQKVETYVRLKRGEPAGPVQLEEPAEVLDADVAPEPPARRGPPPRFVRGPDGRLVITNVRSGGGGKK